MRRTLALLTLAAAACGSDPSGPTFPEQHPRILLPGDGERLRALVADAHPAWTRFLATVDSHVGGADHYAFEAWMVALVGQLTGDPTYCAFAVDAVDADVDAERARIAAGDNPAVAGDSYLEIGAKVGDLALTYDFCADQIPGDMRQRWLGYADAAVWNVWHHDTATWGGRDAAWTGWSVDNPSNNYFYSFLRATMLLGLATHGEAYDGAGTGEMWLAKFRDDKIAGQLVPTFTSDLIGGGSREGTGYGVAMHRLFELYAIWEASTGEDLAGLTPHARASLAYEMHATVPGFDRIAPIGDQSRDSTGMLFDYHRNYVLGLVTQYMSDALAPPALAFLERSTVPEMGQRFMQVYDLLWARPELAPSTLDGVGRAHHAPGAGDLFVRSSWDDDATWWGLRAGPYTETHAHRDQGSLMLWKGEWLAADAVIGSSSGLRQEEEAHNLVRISDGDGTIEQRPGTASSLVALARGDGWLHAAADLTPAYDDHPKVTRVHREVVHVEPNLLVVFDRVASAPGTTQTWHLSSPVAPTLAGPLATIAGTAHTLAVTRLAPAGASASVASWAAVDGDYQSGHRLDAAIGGGDVAWLHVLSLDGAAASATLTAEREATIALADGRTVVVRFGATGVDGHLAITGGATGVDVDLVPGVQGLPE